VRGERSMVIREPRGSDELLVAPQFLNGDVVLVLGQEVPNLHQETGLVCAVASVWVGSVGRLTDLVRCVGRQISG
jgi:hypothetical protein